MGIQPVLLLILDGWGMAPPSPYNALHVAHTPHLDALLREFPCMPLQTHGESVGLPADQMGNSEVGHMHIGSGRRIPSELCRIDHSMQYQGFLSEPALAFLSQQKIPCLHVIGLLSPGGVHAHERHCWHIMDALNAIAQPFVLHAWLDGRDTPPRSAASSLRRAQAHLGQYGSLGSLMGRYWAMDRDHRWERTERAYRLLVHGEGLAYPDWESALSAARGRDEDDEFVLPSVLQDFRPIGSSDYVLALNFRADRMRQISNSLIQPAQIPFVQAPILPATQYISLVPYYPDATNPILFPAPVLEDTLGQIVSEAGMRQLRIAETEKYAHVTFFFNGGKESLYPGEQRVLVPSPSVATYDAQPEMALPQLAEQLLKAIHSREFDCLIANFANLDMVGHTGNLQATVRAAEAIDAVIGKIYDAIAAEKGALILTADHGNAECVYDPVLQQKHTAHTHNPVPCVAVTPGTPLQLSAQLPPGYVPSLRDIAPSVLQLLGLKIPNTMTGLPLFSSPSLPQ